MTQTKNTMENIKKEYQDKISDCDTQLEHIKKETQNIRHGLTSIIYDDAKEAADSRKIVSAQRQCYVQFLADLESIQLTN